MGLEPVLSEPRICYERNTQWEGFLHFFDNDTLYLFLLLWVDGEVEFVVYLKDHLALEIFCLETIEDTNHCHLYDISCCALNGGIDGVALCKAANCSIMRVDIWEVSASSEEGSDIALLTSHILRFLHEPVGRWRNSHQ